MDSPKQQHAFEFERQKSLDFLLKQAELYSHFVTNGSKFKQQNGKRKAATSLNKRSKARKKDECGFISDDLDKSMVEVNNQFDTTPSYITGEMRDYQIRALNWLITLRENGINGILADEMGLGKTLQTISMLGYLKNYENINGPHLIIAPNSTLRNWLNEVNRFCPSLRGLILIGDKEARSATMQQLKHRENWDICITSYEMVLIESGPLKRFDWEYIVVDEAHRIKNENTKLSKTLRKFRSKNRLLLTGTPLQNNLHELWSLLNYLLPDVFASSNDFDSWFDSDNCLSGNNDIVKRLQTILQPFMLRRIKADVEKSLLPKIELKLFVGLTTIQRETYRKVLMKDIQTINALGQASQKTINSILMELRKAANHPYLIDGIEPGPPYTTDQHLIDSCGKMMVLDKLLTKPKSQGSRVVLFSQFVIVLNLLEDYLIWRGHNYCRLDGSTQFEDRTKSIEQFNAENSDKFIFILSTRAGGLGINLTTADTVIIYDSDWNPQSDFQAIDRVHRIGQKKQVRVFRLITENTVDERIVQRAEIKRRLDQMVIQQGRPLEKDSAGQQKGLKRDMIRFGAEHILSSNGSDVMDVDIEQILKDGQLKAAEEDKKLTGLSENGLRNLTFEQASNVSVYQFEGVDFRSMHNSSQTKQLYSESGRPLRAAKQKKKMFSSLVEENDNNNLIALSQHQLYPKRLYDLCEDGENLDLSYDTERKTGLMEKGFPNWTDKQFDQYRKALYKFGRHDLTNISKAIEGKTLDEVKKYHVEVWTRGRTIIEDFNDIAKRVDRTDKLIKGKSLQRLSQANAFNATESERILLKLNMPQWMPASTKSTITSTANPLKPGPVETVMSNLPSTKVLSNKALMPVKVGPTFGPRIPISSHLDQYQESSNSISTTQNENQNPWTSLIDQFESLDNSFNAFCDEHAIDISSESSDSSDSDEELK